MVRVAAMATSEITGVQITSDYTLLTAPSKLFKYCLRIKESKKAPEMAEYINSNAIITIL